MVPAGSFAHAFSCSRRLSPLSGRNSTYRPVQISATGSDLGFNVTPAIDIVEKEKAFEVTAELPGLDAKNIDLQLSDGMLTIKGEKHEDKEEKTKDRYVSERRYGFFRRSLQLPDSVDAEKIDANFKDGILTITLPKSPEAEKKQKTIPVNAK